MSPDEIFIIFIILVFYSYLLINYFYMHANRKSIFKFFYLLILFFFESPV